jgi:hypothetical protein
MRKEWYLSFHGGDEKESLNNIHVYSSDWHEIGKASNTQSLAAGVTLRENFADSPSAASGPTSASQRLNLKALESETSTFAVGFPFCRLTMRSKLTSRTHLGLSQRGKVRDLEGKHNWLENAAKHGSLGAAVVLM